jgi:hypothetical protein
VGVLRGAAVTAAPGPVVERGNRMAAEGAGANYQICALSLSGRTIGSPGLQPKASANA